MSTQNFIDHVAPMIHAAVRSYVETLAPHELRELATESYLVDHEVSALVAA